MKTLLKKILYSQVVYLVGGAVSHFFVHQKIRFVADMEVEVFIVRSGNGEEIVSAAISSAIVRSGFLSFRTPLS